MKYLVPTPYRCMWDAVRNAATVTFAVFTGATVLDKVYQTETWVYWFTYWFHYIAGATFIFFFLKDIHWKSIYSYKVNSYDIKISIVIGNILDEKGSVALSTNSSFATEMEEEVISKYSAQGAFQNRYYEDKVSFLDQKISLELKPKKSRGTIFIKNKLHQIYEIGTVVKVAQDEKRVYLVALNDVNEDGQNKGGNRENIYTAYGSLWDYVSNKGNVEPELNVTLFGAGRAGIADVTRENVAMTIIDTFLISLQNSNAKITDHLRIVILPKDLDNIDLNKLNEYLFYRCKFVKREKQEKIGTML